MTSVCCSLLKNQLTKFWEIENIQEKQILTKDESLCEQMFNATTTLNQDSRFVVQLPCRKN